MLPARRAATRGPYGLRRHLHHLFFAACLLSLASLFAWWTVFIYRAILQEHRFLTEEMEYRGRLYSLVLKEQPGEPPLGAYPGDDRMEIVRSGDRQGRYMFPLAPRWPGLAIRPRADYLESIERRLRRRMVMIVGEGSLLGLLVLSSSFMLYRLISIERRTSRQMQEFWSRITHQIKTPITGLKAFLQTLKTHDIEREELQALIDMALAQVERQEQLAQNILMGQRLAKRFGDARLEPIRLADFVTRFLESHALLLSRCRVEFDPAGCADVTVAADPDSLHVVLDNLADNALKYGGEQPHLRIRLSVADGRAILEFRDHGQGFEPRFAGNIFEAYRRVGNELPEGKHGTGLGLYIARSLARAMGGDLEAASEGPGTGARFTLYLRRAARDG